MNGRDRRLAAGRRARPVGPHDDRHRAPRSAASATTPPSSWPATAPGSSWPAAPPPSSRPTGPRSWRRSPDASLEHARRSTSPTWPRYAGPRPRPAVPRSDRRAGQQRRGDGHAVPPHRRRPRAADGDEPLRPVPADRPAAAAAHREPGRPRRHGRLAHASGRPPGSARRPAPAARAATPAGRSTASPSWPTCSSPTSSTAGLVAPSCRSRRWPRTPATPAPTWPPTVSTAARRVAWPSILDAAIKAISQSAEAGAWPTLMAATAELPGATYCGPSGLGEMAGLPQVVTSNRLVVRRGRAAPTVGAQRADDRDQLPLTGVRSCTRTIPARAAR